MRIHNDINRYRRALLEIAVISHDKDSLARIHQWAQYGLYEDAPKPEEKEKS